MANSSADEQRINTIRFLSVDAVNKANSGHPGMPLGAAATAYTLWTHHLRFNAADTSWIDRDRFILSAGHGSMLLYSLLYLTGCGMTMEDLQNFRQFGSRTPGHPEYRHTPGVEATTGPLGQGVGNSVGFAIAEAHLAATYNRGGDSVIDHFTYCMCGDGDLMEGISQEAISLAGHLKLGKLILLYDDNRVSLAGPTDITFTDDHVARFDAVGWHTETIDIAHGNDADAIDEAITVAKNVTDRPSFINVRTHIGYGSPVQDSFKAHGEPLGEENTKKTKERLGWPLEPLFYVPDDVLTFFRDAGKKGAELQKQWQTRVDAWSKKNPELASQFERALKSTAGTGPSANASSTNASPANGSSQRDSKQTAGTGEQAAAWVSKLPWPEFTEANGAVATRDAGSVVMNAIAGTLPQLVGGSADLDPSTKTYLKDCGDFQPGDYAGRNIHFGVREHAMAAACNGIAYHGGLLPFAATFFNFSDYMKPSVRLAALAKLHTLFVFTHDSVFLGEDGPTHEPIEQLAMLRAMPNLTVIRPADAIETREAWKLMVTPHDGPFALVLTRQKVPFLGNRQAPVGRGAYVLADTAGDKIDLLLIATGSEVSLAVDAKKLLDVQGIATRVVSLPCWSLFESQPQSYRDEILPPNVTARMSIEAAATFGWSRWVGDKGFAFGIDHFGTSAPAQKIAEAYGFTPQNIANVAKRKI